VFHLGFTHVYFIIISNITLWYHITKSVFTEPESTSQPTQQKTVLHNLQTPNSAPSKCTIRHKSWL